MGMLFNKWKEIFKVRIDNYSNEKIKRDLKGKEFTIKNEDGTHERIRADQIKKKVFDQAESGKSIENFRKNVLIDELGMKGTARDIDQRNKLTEELARIQGAIKEEIIKPKKELPNLSVADDYPVADVEKDYEQYNKIKGVRL